MSKRDLKKVLEKQPFQGRIIYVPPNLIWTNEVFCVENDPNLKKCVKEREIQPNKTYYIQFISNELEIFGEHEDRQFKRSIEELLHKRIIDFRDKFRLSLLEDNIKTISVDGIESYSLFLEDKKRAVLIDRDYLDYLFKLSEIYREPKGELYLLNCKSSLCVKYISKEVNALIAPLNYGAICNIKIRKIEDILQADAD